MPLKDSVFEAPKLVSTKTPLLKHYYRRQGWNSLRSAMPTKVFAHQVRLLHATATITACRLSTRVHARGCNQQLTLQVSYAGNRAQQELSK